MSVFKPCFLLFFRLVTLVPLGGLPDKVQHLMEMEQDIMRGEGVVDFGSAGALGQEE
jgi:hypothetical protein